MARKKADYPLLEGLEITTLAAEGKAMGRWNEQVVFVPMTVPGDVVDVQIRTKRRRYMEGYVVRYVHRSPLRVEPFCEHFGVCGGCKWQNLPYDEQLRFKREQVRDQLTRIGKVELPEIAPCLGSAETQFYRNKLEFTFSERRWIETGEDPEEISAEDRVGLGFHVGRFFDKVLDIKHCYLQKDPSDSIRLFIRQYAISHGLTFFNIREHRGLLRNMIIRSTEAGSIMLIMCFYYDDPDARRGLLDAVSEAFPQISSIYYVINGKANDSIADRECILYKGDDAVYEEMEGLKFRIGPKSFYQTNSLQAYRLYSVARDFARLNGDETVYDLYTGTGTIAQFVSGKARKVVGIEYVPEAIEDARANARANGITNCEFFAGDMKDVLNAGFISRHGHPDVVILDPPRAGIHPDVAKVILEAAPDRIVYVSCNPASQARDLAVICEKYRITAVQPVDMFPHTHHVENVVALERTVRKEI